MSDVSYRYKLIDMRNIECKRFLYSGVPEEIILSMLCNMGGRDERIFVRQILIELIKVAKGLDLSKNLRQIEILSRLRGMQKIVIEEVEQMPIVLDLETDIRFMQGVQKGRVEGIEEGRVDGLHDAIEVLLRAKFGEKGLSLMQKISRYKDQSRLRAITL
ncbi:MAG: hypothetical protein HQL06_02385 [Nitrospirae bacterium]|nr:hypothetical protein [Nitrospirota bacterium]